MSVTQENWELDEIMVHEMMISSEKVAHVQSNNPLEHALLVLVKSGYSAVPVLDTEYKLVGLISKTVILNEILGLERFETERLSEMKVSDVMNKEEISIKETATFADGLNALINLPFICVIDDKGHFEGILTRRAILKELKKDYYMSKNK